MQLQVVGLTLLRRAGRRPQVAMLFRPFSSTSPSATPSSTTTAAAGVSKDAEGKDVKRKLTPG